jgi:hypothetical protein
LLKWFIKRLPWVLRIFNKFNRTKFFSQRAYMLILLKFFKFFF